MLCGDGRIPAKRDGVSHSLSTRDLLEQVAHSPNLLRSLRAHAERRLHRVRRSLPEGAMQHLDGEDLVQEALAMAFLGLRSRKQGRHPRPKHRADLVAFTHWLRSLINSLVSNLRAGALARCRRLKRHLELATPRHEPGVLDQVDFQLRMAALIAALRREFSGRPVILQLLRDWERDCAHLDRLPGKPFNAHVVRQAAKRFLRRNHGQTRC